MKEITITEKDKCYICGRTSKDFELLRTKVLEQLDSDTAKLLKDREAETARLEELKRIGSSIDENHKALLIHSVSSEINTYKKIIPGIEKLIQFYRNEFGPGPQKVSLGDVLSYLSSTGSKELKRVMVNLENRPEFKNDSKHRAQFLENRNIQLSPNASIPIGFRINYEISLCLVCNQLIENLEKSISSMR